MIPDLDISLKMGGSNQGDIITQLCLAAELNTWTNCDIPSYLVTAPPEDFVPGVDKESIKRPLDPSGVFEYFF